jgi:hypothetical protein
VPLRLKEEGMEVQLSVKPLGEAGTWALARSDDGSNKTYCISSWHPLEVSSSVIESYINIGAARPGGGWRGYCIVHSI